MEFDFFNEKVECVNKIFKFTNKLHTLFLVYNDKIIF